MVEPAIAITAMNIATLRPLFKNFLSFASKRFDSSIDEEDNVRPSADSRSNFARSNSVSAKDYSVEFAELLGLSRVGVTTHITAGGSEAERDLLRKRWTNRKSGRSFKEEKQRAYNNDESSTELENILADANVQEQGAVNWTAGIKTTTVITTDTN